MGGLCFQVAAMLIQMVFVSEVQWQLSLLTFYISMPIALFVTLAISCRRWYDDITLFVHVVFLK